MKTPIKKKSLKIVGFHRHSIIELPGDYVSLTWTTHVRKQIGFDIFRQRLEEGWIMGRHDQITESREVAECLRDVRNGLLPEVPTNIIAVNFNVSTQQNAI